KLRDETLVGKVLRETEGISVAANTRPRKAYLGVCRSVYCCPAVCVVSGLSESALELTQIAINITSKIATRNIEAMTVDTQTWQIVWRNVIAFIYLHVSSFYALYLIFTGQCKLSTFFFAMGVTAGAHRLWAHRAYKARWPLRLFLAILQTMAFQNHIYEWVRDHRVHHKFTETDADPHNAKRGFFFSHIGWLMIRKHKDVFEKGATVDMSDLEKDSIVIYIGATDNKTVAILAFGEGWHNYHHVFPWDYKAAELGDYSTNLSTALIDFAAKYGLAYDLKTVSMDMIRKRVLRTGDGSHPMGKAKAGLEEHEHPENPVWGWDDTDMPEEDKKMAEIAHKLD
ncbi:unnamed protein product, partial [Leptidea sinapis]